MATDAAFTRDALAVRWVLWKKFTASATPITEATRATRNRRIVVFVMIPSSTCWWRDPSKASPARRAQTSAAGYMCPVFEGKPSWRDDDIRDVMAPHESLPEPPPAGDESRWTG